MRCSATDIDAWFRKIMHEKVRPNAAQLAYLRDVRDRCLQECSEQQRMATAKPKFCGSEPYRKCILGPPGTGKSECLKWTSRLFEEVFGWTHGVQYQKIAPQHTMAILIGGQTVHSWGQVPITPPLCRLAGARTVLMTSMSYSRNVRVYAGFS